MHKKKGFSLIEVIAAVAIMAMLSLAVFGMFMQSNKSMVFNSTTISETSALEGIADFMYSAPINYYTKNLGLKDETKNINGTDKCEFTIESDTLNGLINSLNNIEIGGNNESVITPNNNGESKIKFIGNIKISFIKDKIYGCQILLYTTKNGAMISILNREQLEQGGFYNGDLTEEYKTTFSLMKRNIMINTVEGNVMSTESSKEGNWKPSSNIPGDGWVPSGWNPNANIPKNIESPLNWGSWGHMKWFDWIPGSWSWTNWIDVGNGFYQMKNASYEYNNNTGIVYQENNIGQYIEIGRTIPNIFNDWQRDKWFDWFDSETYESEINPNIFYDNNNGEIYYGLGSLIYHKIFDKKTVRSTIPHIFTWN